LPLGMGVDVGLGVAVGGTDVFVGVWVGVVVGVGVGTIVGVWVGVADSVAVGTVVGAVVGMAVAVGVGTVVGVSVGIAVAVDAGVSAIAPPGPGPVQPAARTRSAKAIAASPARKHCREDVHRSLIFTIPPHAPSGACPHPPCQVSSCGKCALSGAKAV
jgi:hypothetical protein